MSKRGRGSRPAYPLRDVDMARSEEMPGTFTRDNVESIPARYAGCREGASPRDQARLCKHVLGVYRRHKALVVLGKTAPNFLFPGGIKFGCRGLIQRLPQLVHRTLAIFRRQGTASLDELGN
jgi:hypothetical protein